MSFLIAIILIVEHFIKFRKLSKYINALKNEKGVIEKDEYLRVTKALIKRKYLFSLVILVSIPVPLIPLRKTYDLIITLFIDYHPDPIAPEMLQSLLSESIQSTITHYAIVITYFVIWVIIFTWVSYLQSKLHLVEGQGWFRT